MGCFDNSTLATQGSVKKQVLPHISNFKLYLNAPTSPISSPKLEESNTSQFLTYVKLAQLRVLMNKQRSK